MNSPFLINVLNFKKGAQKSTSKGGNITRQTEDLLITLDRKVKCRNYALLCSGS